MEEISQKLTQGIEKQRKKQKKERKRNKEIKNMKEKLSKTEDKLVIPIIDLFNL